MTDAKPELKIWVGTVLIGKYRVTREIGRGGMAAVYEALHLTLGKKVALKVLSADLSASRTVIERFFREARAAAAVKSPYIVDIYDSGRLEDGRPFIAMEMLDGETLYDLMTRVRLIDTRTTLRIITQCAKGLMKAHSAGVVHRDLKPENIFLLTGDDGEETLKLLDFGLAKFYEPTSPDEKSARLTREGAVFGTPAYMSPEQVKGQGTVDHRADLWALGCVTFECLTGRPVWAIEQGVAMTFAAIASSPLPVPSALRPGLPPAFDAWFRRALERDPNRRFQCARDLADALARAFGQSSGISQGSGELDLGGIEPSSQPWLEFDASHGAPAALPASPRADDSAKTMAQGEDSRPDLPYDVVESPGSARAAARRSASPRGLALRYAASILVLIASSTSAYLTWDRVLRPQVKTQLVVSTVAYVPEAPAVSFNGGSLPQDTPRWQTALEDGQQLFAAGDFAAALEKFKRAQDLGAPPLAARAFVEQTKIGQAGGGACKMAAFSRPRMALGGNALRPSVASSAKRTLLSWSDDHEQPGQQHVYAVLLDAAGRSLSRPRDLTPEAIDAGRASLVAVGDRLALIYSDRVGPQVGVRARWIDEEGRIAGATMQVGGVRPGTYWPALQRAPDGLFAVWDDERKQDGADLFLRHLGPNLDPIGPEIRATDYPGHSGRRPFIRTPAVAAANNALYVVYKVEREGQPHSIERMRIPLDAPSLATGLDYSDPQPTKTDRALGDVEVVSESGTASESPGIACGTEGCFVVWHGQRGGAYVALIDPMQGHVIWRKKFAERGGAPALGASDSGTVAVVFYEAGAVRIAMLAREGVGEPSTFARVTGEAPHASVAAGRTKDEWLVAWQDNEGSHTEVYAARVVCR